MLFRDLFAKKCAICQRKVKPLRPYFDKKGKEIKVCLPCTEYAERRAYKLKR